MTASLRAPPAAAEHLPDTPYVGLVPYTEADAAFFFGRAEEQHVVAGNLRASRLTILYGPSGVGKTSLLQAGVVHDLHARVLAAADPPPERAPFGVSVIREWRDEPLPALMTAIHASAIEALGGRELPPWRPDQPPVEALRAWTQRVRTLLVVLDQFEDYFLYHPAEEAFDTEFPAIVNEPNLRVNFLLSLREDAWAKLDRFEGRIPALFANYVRVEHLDRGTGREAIQQPVAEWNRRLPESEPPYDVEPALTAAVLDAAAGAGLAPAEGVPTDDAVEAPFLQLVMERLWRATVDAGARELTLARLEDLGGAQRIVENHLLDALRALTPAEQAVAADLFRYLVTRSKAKIAHQASDLAEWTGRPEPQVTAVLDKLCRGESGRILRAVSPGAGEQATRYELFHDVLAEPVLDWRRWFQHRRDRRRALKRYVAVVGGLLLLVVAAALGIWALAQQRNEAEQRRAEAQAAQRSAATLGLAWSASAARQGRLDAALLLGVEANRRGGSAEARDATINALATAQRLGVSAILHAPQAVRNMALSADGRTLAAAEGDTVRLWDLGARRPLGTLSPEDGPVSGIALSADGATLAVAGGRSAGLWDVATLDPLAEPMRTTATFDGAAFSPDLRRLATFHEGDVTLWDMERGRETGELDRPLGSGVVSLAFMPGARRLATANGFGQIHVWSERTGRRLDYLGGGAATVAFGTDGRTIVLSGYDGKIRMRDVDTRRPRGRPLEAGSASSLWAVALAGRTLAAGGQDGAVLVWDLRQRARLGRPLRHPGGSFLLTSVAFSPDGRLLAAPGFQGPVLWDARTHEPRGDLRFRGRLLRRLAFSEDSRTLAGVGGNTLMLWDVEARGSRGERLRGTGGRCPVQQIELSDGNTATCDLKSVAFSPDGRVLAATTVDEAVQLWDAATREPLGALRGHDQLVRAIAFSPDGRLLVSGSYDGTVRLWDVRARRSLARLAPRPAGPIYGVAFSPDGRTVAIGTSDGRVLLWDARTREPTGTLAGHVGAVAALAFSPDGRTLASGSLTDVTMRLWDVPTRRPLWQTPRSGRLSAVAFSPDGRTLASAGIGESVRLWEGIVWSDWDDLRDRVCDLVLGNLTADEWRQYARDVKPRTTC